MSCSDESLWWVLVSCFSESLCVSLMNRWLVPLFGLLFVVPVSGWQLVHLLTVWSSDKQMVKYKCPNPFSSAVLPAFGTLWNPESLFFLLLLLPLLSFLFCCTCFRPSMICAAIANRTAYCVHRKRRKHSGTAFWTRGTLNGRHFEQQALWTADAPDARHSGLPPEVPGSKQKAC